MNFLEKLFIKAAKGRMEAHMPQLKRWGPVLGELILVASVTFSLVGQGDTGSLIAGIGSALGWTTAAPVPMAELASAAGKLIAVGALLFGLVRLFLARFTAIRIKGGGWKSLTPALGEFAVVGIVTAKLVGNLELAGALETAATLFGLLGQAPIPLSEVGAAGTQTAAVVAVIVGLWAKFEPAIRNAQR